MSEIKRPSLVVSPELAAEVDAGSRKMLKVPPDADQKGAGTRAEFNWIEQLRIIDTKVFDDKKNPNVTVFEVKFRVPDDTPFPTNAGSAWDVFLRINNEVFPGGDKNDGQWKMSSIALRLLRQLVVACGIEMPKDESVDIVDFYLPSAPGEQPPLVGSVLYAKIAETPRKVKQGQPESNERDQNVLRFASEDAIGKL